MRVCSKGNCLSVPFGLPLPRLPFLDFRTRRVLGFGFVVSFIVLLLYGFYGLWSASLRNPFATLDVAHYIDSLFH